MSNDFFAPLTVGIRFRTVCRTIHLPQHYRFVKGDLYMATADFEARQLLKAYRKGLISDTLFEEQMRELGTGNGGGYCYNGKMHATEREMVMHLLDELRCAENFASEYLNCWMQVSDQECVKGGLRMVQQRETFHAQVLEARLRELGGMPQCTVPTERRDK